MIDHLPRLLERGLVGERAAGIRIAIEARKVAARDFDAYGMAGEKHVARYACVDHQRINLSWLGEFSLFQSVPVTHSQDAIRQITRLTVRKHVHQLGRKVGIGSRGGRV